MAKIKGVLVNTNTFETTVEEIEKSLDSYYALLKCDTIDIASRKVDGTNVEIICDDEFFIKDNPKPEVSAIYTDNTIAFMGNIFVVGFDGQDDLRSLTSNEIRVVLNNIMQNGILKLTY